MSENANPKRSTDIFVRSDLELSVCFGFRASNLAAAASHQAKAERTETHQ
jgi:hypothetical protein